MIIPIAQQQYGINDLSWDPTGRYLAIARFTPSQTETVPPAPLDIYAVSQQRDQAHLVARFSGAFVAIRVTWSPDGNWLAMDAGLQDSQGYDDIEGYVIPLWRMLSPLPVAGTPVVHRTLSLKALKQAPSAGPWRPGSAAEVTAIDHTGVLTAYNVETGDTNVIGNLGFPSGPTKVGGVCASSWTPDSRSLLFALCAPESGDWLGLPPKLFVYQAPLE